MAVEKVFQEIAIKIDEKAKAFNLAICDDQCMNELNEIDDQIEELEKQKNKIIEKYTNYYLVKAKKEEP